MLATFLISRQLYAKNLMAGVEQIVDGSSQDQVDPAISKQRIVWQDFRDDGIVEIYLNSRHYGA